MWLKTQRISGNLSKFSNVKSYIDHEMSRGRNKSPHIVKLTLTQ
jgi:hypothetical protein